jgi:hypothetical protein
MNDSGARGDRHMTAPGMPASHDSLRRRLLAALPELPQTATDDDIVAAVRWERRQHEVAVTLWRASRDNTTGTDAF